MNTSNNQNNPVSTESSGILSSLSNLYNRCSKAVGEFASNAYEKAPILTSLSVGAGIPLAGYGSLHLLDYGLHALPITDPASGISGIIRLAAAFGVAATSFPAILGAGLVISDTLEQRFSGQADSANSTEPTDSDNSSPNTSSGLLHASRGIAQNINIARMMM